MEMVLLESLKIKLMEHQRFLSLKNQKKLVLNFYKILLASYKCGNSKNCEFFKQF